MIYKGYNFETRTRGFGLALYVQTPDGKQAAFCTPTSSQYQSDVFPPIQYPNQITFVKRDQQMADKIIDRIENGHVNYRYKYRLNQIS